ncbi:hypothetical protein F441_03496, partial [Phytophthora nicotianae CJ01A1]
MAVDVVALGCAAPSDLIAHPKQSNHLRSPKSQDVYRCWRIYRDAPRGSNRYSQRLPPFA